VIVNNSTLISKSITLNNIRHENRTIGTGGAREVVVNQGPALATIQEASGRKIKTVPIEQAARQTRVPVGLTRGTGELNGREMHAIAPGEKPKSATEHAAPPNAHGEPPAKNHPAPTEAPASSPHGPPGPFKPPGASPRPANGKDEGIGHDHEGGHHGKD
jgi:hypothetical protein